MLKCNCNNNRFPLVDVGPLGRLTRRETETLRLIAAGLTYQETADILQVTERTVRCYMSRITEKLNVTSGHMAGLWGLFAGLITPAEILDVWRVHRPQLMETEL
jgi:DNA-binding CsgD family transcriptional regulator